MTSQGADIQGVVFFALATAIASFIGLRKGFFSAPPFPRQHLPTFLLVAGAFGIYFITSLIVPHFLVKFWSFGALSIPEVRVQALSWVSFLTSSAILAGLLAFFFSIYPPIRKSIWQPGPHADFKSDALLALAAWLISMPAVLLSSHLLELLLYFFFGQIQLPDQIAVLFLKMTLGYPFYFFQTSFTIAILAPIVEELLFRGFLQSYLRRYFNSLPAICLSSACFAIFHFSREQGLGNLPILGSLFIFALFLGFLYERQGSLRSPILLHGLFNALSIANLYFLGIDP